MKTVLIQITFLLAFIFGAAAHSKVETSIPANGSILEQFPRQIEIMFDQPTRATKVTLKHMGRDGEQEYRLKLPTKDFVKQLILKPQSYGNGVYQINWRALAKDGHAMKGSFSFTIKAN